MSPLKLPTLDLSLLPHPSTRPLLLTTLKSSLLTTGFLYLTNHGIPSETITALTSRIPSLFSLPPCTKAQLSKSSSPHFTGYSKLAEEVTQGHRDLREQFDFATELPVIWQEEKATGGERDLSKLYWRLRGPNQWPNMEGFREALETYMGAMEELSRRFVHLIEEALEIPAGTFDSFFTSSGPYLPPQHRLKLIKYPPSTSRSRGQGVGAHKDSSGWLTFLLQIGTTTEETEGLQVLNPHSEEWVPVPAIPGSLVVNFGNAFEAATSGGVRATVHRVLAPKSTSPPRYSIPFFMGLPLDMTVDEIKRSIPDKVHRWRSEHEKSDFVQDKKWEQEELGVAQLRKWFRSHKEVAEKWYSAEVVENFLR